MRQHPNRRNKVAPMCYADVFYLPRKSRKPAPVYPVVGRSNSVIRSEIPGGNSDPISVSARRGFMLSTAKGSFNSPPSTAGLSRYCSGYFGIRLPEDEPVPVGAILPLAPLNSSRTFLRLILLSLPNCLVARLVLIPRPSTIDGG